MDEEEELSIEEAAGAMGSLSKWAKAVIKAQDMLLRLRGLQDKLKADKEASDKAAAERQAVEAQLQETRTQIEDELANKKTESDSTIANLHAHIAALRKQSDEADTQHRARLEQYANEARKAKTDSEKELGKIRQNHDHDIRFMRQAHETNVKEMSAEIEELKRKKQQFTDDLKRMTQQAMQGMGT